MSLESPVSEVEQLASVESPVSVAELLASVQLSVSEFEQLVLALGATSSAKSAEVEEEPQNRNRNHRRSSNNNILHHRYNPDNFSALVVAAKSEACSGHAQMRMKEAGLVCPTVSSALSASVLELSEGVE